MISAEKRKELPEENGVYMLLAGDELLYVGKAKSIRQRVGDHFRDKNWINNVTHIDFLLLPTEEEALLTERELIQSRRPRYNVRLRDDRSYPMIAISLEEEYPRVFLTREKRRSDRIYFGPWTDSRRARKLLRTLPQIFPFRSCSGATPGRGGQGPCLDYYIERCGAPCIGKVSAKEYRKGINQIIEFLSGRRTAIEDREKAQMQEAARSRDYERAALHRDRLRSIEKLSDRGKHWGRDRNVLAVALQQQDAALSLLEIREGRIAERRVFLLRNEDQLPEEEVLEKFLELLPQDYPRSEEPAELVELARRDARLQLLHDQSRRAETSLHPEEALSALEEITRKRPLRIEGYDIANLGESATVGVMVLFEEGLHVPRATKRKQLQREDPDDYQSMRDLLAWRSQAFLEHSEMSPFDPRRSSTLAELPDVILVDGGAGQLSAALEAGQELQKRGVAFLALAKKQETLWNQTGQLDISPDNPGSQLLQRVRDEAHRASNSAHRRLRKKETLRSPLTAIPGIGPRKQTALLEHFGSLEAVRSATEADLCQVKGISKSLAKEIKEKI